MMLVVETIRVRRLVASRPLTWPESWTDGGTSDRGRMHHDLDIPASRNTNLVMQRTEKQAVETSGFHITSTDLKRRAV